MLSLLSLLAAILFGSMLFFFALIAPSVTKFWGAENAGRYVDDLFPRFYLWGAGFSAVACAAAAYQRSYTAILFLIVFGGYLYARQRLNPKISRARETWLASDSPQDKSVFAKLHKKSILVSVIQIVLLGILIVVG